MLQCRPTGLQTFAFRHARLTLNWSFCGFLGGGVVLVVMGSDHACWVCNRLLFERATDLFSLVCSYRDFAPALVS
jgi:hypothetical protein